MRPVFFRATQLALKYLSWRLAYPILIQSFCRRIDDEVPDFTHVPGVFTGTG